MKTLTLSKLHLRNFKGIKDFTLTANGENVSVFGDNGTGKTTLFDALIWLLFDKDSQNKKDFNIKTLDETGNAISGLDHEVEGVLQLDHRTVVLRKAYAEKWTKKRGSVHAEFTGHTTEYYIDDVPKPKKEFDAFIRDVLDENVFKLLTNPAYFNEVLSWQERRETLLDICGDVSDEDVIASDRDLAKLPAILNGRTLDDHRKVIAARRAEINDELNKVPVRIDEAERGLPDVSGLVADELQTEIAKLRFLINTKNQEASRIENGGQIAELQRQVTEIDAILMDIQNKHKAQFSNKVHEKKMKLQELKLNLAGIETRYAINLRTIEEFAAEIKRCEVSREVLREKWHAANGCEFVYTPDPVCPTCGQNLPESQLDATRQKALEKFNIEKSQEIEAINLEGRKHKEKAAKLQAEIDSAKAGNNQIEQEKSALLETIAALQTEIDSITKSTGDVITTPEYIEASNDKLAILDRIDNLKTGTKDAVAAVQKEIDEFNQSLAAMETSLVKVDQHRKGQERIKELKTQGKELAAEFERLDGELFLADQFIRTKVNLLESRINSKFKYARFKLFNIQVNGGLAECFDTTFNGVPYSSGLNSAAKVMVGLDIINTLSDYYGFSPVIFIDNRESVVRLIETKAQIISLVVSAPDKALRVEREGNILKEAG